jgi:hypothetical protein
MGYSDPWSRHPDWTDEEWAEEVKRRRAIAEQAVRLLNEKEDEARKRRRLWKERTEGMTPRQIGWMLRDMLDYGLTYEEISEAVGASRDVIKKYCRISRVASGNKPRNVARDAAIREAYKAGATAKELSNKYGISVTRIRQIVALTEKSDGR